MRTLRLLLVSILALGLIALAGCSGKKVTRIDTDTTIDLSGKWNDADSRMVSEEVIEDMLKAPWVVRFSARNEQARPTVIVGLMRNRSDEHIVTETFTKDIERACINQGTVRIVASSEERADLRDERSDQADFSSAATVKKFGLEYGADYMLMGTINKISDREDDEEIIFYQVDLELTDIETNEKVWIGGKKHKKYIGRDKYKS
ncbi:penicillin-binding protein activator LpoB [bacterium]|nr:MAG: penicillin-binding protein activator LpoB [bacterium]RKZ16013.1 MAG: penicillin-binding protein activator LpoB [bacterium]